ncbi:hypothetical protein NHQ30_004615 [Ciborinia camelliae]|nr:hypothetical protein NHQ30_004615 [Ciborinia camelliae]
MGMASHNSSDSLRNAQEADSPTNPSVIDSRSESTARVPTYTLLEFNSRTSRLVIRLDFESPDPSPEETTLDQMNFMIDILPRYADETHIILLDMFFKSSQVDDLSLSPAREQVLNRVIETINAFPNTDGIEISLSGPDFSWEQIKPLSALFGINFGGRFRVMGLVRGINNKVPGTDFGRRLRDRYFNGED